MVFYVCICQRLPYDLAFKSRARPGPWLCLNHFRLAIAYLQITEHTEVHARPFLQRINVIITFKIKKNSLS